MEKEKYEREGARLKEALKYMRDHVDAHYSQRTLAADLHYTEQTISHYASGKHRMSDDDYQRLADLWGMRVEYLRGDDDFMFDDDLLSFVTSRNAEWFKAHLELLRHTGCNVTPMLYLKIYDIAALTTYWDEIKPTLCDEEKERRYKDNFCSLGAWDGTRLQDLGFVRHGKYNQFSRDTSAFDDYIGASEMFWSEGLRVRNVIDGCASRRVSDAHYVRDVNFNFKEGLYYVIRYCVKYNSENTSYNYSMYEGSSSHFYSIDQMILMFEDMDAHILAVLHSSAHDNFRPNYDDDDAAMDRDDFDWNES